MRGIKGESVKFIIIRIMKGKLKEGKNGEKMVAVDFSPCVSNNYNEY